MLSLLSGPPRVWAVKASRLAAVSHNLTGGVSCGKRSLPFFAAAVPQHLTLVLADRKSFHSLTRTARDDAVLVSPFIAANNIINPTIGLSRHTLHPFQPQQVRWKRKGGASAFAKPRPPTQKQRKKRNRWKKEMHWQKEGRHSKPGSKAADRRVWAKQEWDDLMMYDTPERQALIDKHAPKASEYDHHDALLEDLMGNTAHLSSQPAPQPVYLGHKQKKYFKKVQNAMNSYLQFKEEQQLQIESGATKEKEAGEQLQSDKTSVVTDLALAERLLPTDRDISMALRAYRDRNGTRQKPIGIATALQHLLKDLRLPTSLFGELTYTALLTCCRTPAEAQRIFKMQRDVQHTISAYSWSILVDVHAKLGDFEGCVKVMQEMAAEGVTPTMAAYTSLMAACYKVCADGRIPQVVRIQAYEVGWTKWKELRIIGLDPDVMAYGAMLRLCAVKGHAERAINLLEEMPIMDVKPTTLCFTSALRAVARSQEIAVRYERGWSKKNKRREQITLHHGKMARSIVILAENAEVKQDDGFVAALMLCAAAAGDSATAKAIYLASDVRKMDHLRTIGSDSHLQRLEGRKVPFDENNQRELLADREQRRTMITGTEKSNENNALTEGGDSASASLNTIGSSTFGSHAFSDPISVRNDLKPKDISILSTPSFRRRRYRSFGEREYGRNDTRKLNALLNACAKALDSQNGLGTMWGGQENQGFLCENSLRLINARRQPKYFDASIPNVDPVDLGIAAIDFDRVTDGIELLSRRARKSKMDNLDLHPNAPLDIFDLDDETTKAITGRDIKKEMEEEERRQKAKEERVNRRREAPKMLESHAGPATSTASQDADEMYFDQDEMVWKTRPKQYAGSPLKGLQEGLRATAVAVPQLETSRSATTGDNTRLAEYDTKSDNITFSNMPITNAVDPDDDPELELYVDEEDSTLKTRPAKGIKGNRRGLHAAEMSTTSASDLIEEETYFDMDDMAWKTRQKAAVPLMPTIIVGGQTESKDDDPQMGEELYFDSQEMQWKSRPKQKQTAIENIEAKVEAKRQHTSREDDSSIMDLLNEFEMDDKNKKIAKYIMSLEDELEGYDEEGDMSSEGTHAGFEQPKRGTDVKSSSRGSGFFLSERPRHDNQDSGLNVDELDLFDSISSKGNKSSVKDKRNELIANFADTPTDSSRNDSEIDSDDLQDFLDSLSSNSADSSSQRLGLQLQPQRLQAGLSKIEQGNRTASKSTAFFDEEFASGPGFLREINVDDSALRERSERDFDVKQPRNAVEALQLALPGLPLSRIHKIRETFKGSLGDPPLLKLIPILRQNMPEYVTPGWLKQLNLQNAHFAFQKAKEDGVVDIYLLNGILEVEASAGRLNRTVQLYEEEFQKYNIEPTEYTDRLVLQMLIKNDRVPRALQFKEQLERAGRTVDIQGYGSLMDYYGRKEQLGSALLVLRECLATHGAPPGEACLTRIRTLCRREGLEKQVGLKEMIGDDPLDWLREGETKLKREYSKKGNRDVNIPNNRLLHI